MILVWAAIFSSPVGLVGSIAPQFAMNAEFGRVIREILDLLFRAHFF
jgi:hypothetical protein